MNIMSFIALLTDGRFKSAYDQRPAALSMSDLVKECLNASYGRELDAILGYLQIYRIKGYFNPAGGAVPEESDTDFRDRGKAACNDLDTLDWNRIADRSGPVMLDKSFCMHNWKKYCGLFEEYDYCLSCNKKKDEVEPTLINDISAFI